MVGLVREVVWLMRWIQGECFREYLLYIGLVDLDLTSSLEGAFHRWRLSIYISQVFWGDFRKSWLERRGRSSWISWMVPKRNFCIEWADFGANQLLKDVLF